MKLSESHFPNVAYQIDDVDCVFSGTAGTGKKAGIDITYFFRYPRIFHAVARVLASDIAPPNPKILSAPSSIGCEAYTLACIFNRYGLYETVNPRIETTDISEKKLRAAKTGTYPIALYSDIPQDYKEYFYKNTKRLFSPRSHIADKVDFLEPTNLAADMPLDREYFISLCFNLILYLPDDDKKRLLQKLAFVTSHMICLSYGGEIPNETIAPLARAVLKEHGFEPNPVFNDIDLLNADIFFRQPG